MRLRRFLGVLRPWRWFGVCTKCGWSGEPRPWRRGDAFPSVPAWECGRPGCEYLCQTVRVRAPWVWPAVAAACLLTGLLLGATGARADAPSSYVLQWREPVLVKWEAGCTRPPEATLVEELEAGWSAVRADLGGKAPGPLGDLPLRPYTLRFMPNPGCGGQAGCSTKALEYREARFDCDVRASILSVNHELEHRKAYQLRNLIRLLGRDVSYVVKWAGHHVKNDPKRPVLGVLGRPRP